VERRDIKGLKDIRETRESLGRKEIQATRALRD
jgi:hypothetical protein